MKLSELIKGSKTLTSDEFERKLNKLTRENYRYKNLDKKNKKLLLDITKKHRNQMRQGIGLSHSALKNEMNKLHRNRFKNDLSDKDIKDIREVLGAFKK